MSDCKSNRCADQAGGGRGSWDWGWKDSVRVVFRLLFFFFFQAEYGIRDLTVTGVQTCDLPILFARMDTSTEWDAWREGLIILRWLAPPEAVRYATRGLALFGPTDEPEHKVREAVKVLEAVGGPAAAQALSNFLTEGMAEATPVQARWRDWIRIRAARALWRVDPTLAAKRFHELAQGVDHAPLGLYAGAIAELPWAFELAEAALE